MSMLFPVLLSGRRDDCLTCVVGSVSSGNLSSFDVIGSKARENAGDDKHKAIFKVKGEKLRNISSF